MMRFSIKTLGCKVNAYESAFYAEKLEEKGWTQDDEQYDVCIINTCTVTNTAAAKSRQMVHRARRQCPQAKIVVAGCYVQTAQEEEKQRLEADLLVGAHGKSKLADAIVQLFNNEQKLTDFEEGAGFESMPVARFEGRNRAFLKVEDGCNQFCSYCAIPFARGRERSLDFDQAVTLAKELASQGHEEIVLTGIHTGRYTSQGKDLADLLEALLAALPENVTFRISSIEITEVSDKLLDVMQNRRMMPHLHIPIQSGNDEVLKRMHRPYTIAEFSKRLEDIRRAVPDISISTDVIAGFCQESEEEFADTMKNLEAMGFSFLHVFPYSPRRGTAAENMGAPVHPKERTAKLLELSKKLRMKDMARFQEADVLVEQEKNGIWTGYSQHYHPVHIQSSSALPNRVHVSVAVGEDGIYIAKEGI